jgi:hypothetical protein
VDGELGCGYFNPKGIDITQPKVATKALPWVEIRRISSTLKELHHSTKTKSI